MSEEQEFQADPQIVESYFKKVPEGFKHAGYIWPGRRVSLERLGEIENIDYKPDDIIIASYPKSGTMWLCEMVSMIATSEKLEDVRAIPFALRVPWLERHSGNNRKTFFMMLCIWIYQFFSCLFGGKKQGVTFSMVKESFSQWTGCCKKEQPQNTISQRIWWTHLPAELLPEKAKICKIIYVSRNPKDVAVSFFNWHTFIETMGFMDITWNDFYEVFLAGEVYSGSWFSHVLNFYDYSRGKDNVLSLKYEDMKMDLAKEVGKICDFVNSSRSAEEREKIVDFSQFNAMKKNAMDSAPTKKFVNTFMRKGQIGDWINQFTVTQDEIFDKVYEQKMKNTDLKFLFETDEESLKKYHS